ncbi:MAG: amidohydrolase [Bacteroidetes bacterium]|nr:amidohydrolase [Bacteroidota bacterium]
MTKNELHIALIQADLHWENPATNLAMFTDLINDVHHVDLMILPEMFSSGFTMHPESVAETMDGKSVSWMRETAQKKKIALTGSLVIEENGNYYNRLLFVKPNGTIEKYDKKHLFTLAGEDVVYTAGTDRLILDYLGWHICPMVCYDLRFPVWARNTADYDLLIYVANWPKVRVYAWDTLLAARAIENMSYVAGVNRVGKDGNGHPYVGHSAVYDMLGKGVLPKISGKKDVYFVTLNKKELESARKKLRFLDDRDHFTWV